MALAGPADRSRMIQRHIHVALCSEKAASASSLLHACDDLLALRIRLLGARTTLLMILGPLPAQVPEFCPIRIDDFDRTLNGNNVRATCWEQHAKICAQDDLSRRNSQNSKQIQQLLGCLRPQDSRDLGRYRTYERR
jgi:hypothetical protein